MYIILENREIFKVVFYLKCKHLYKNILRLYNLFTQSIVRQNNTFLPQLNMGTMDARYFQIIPCKL